MSFNHLRGIRLSASLIAVLLISACSCEVSKYDIAWDTPSEDASGSMPAGIPGGMGREIS